MVKDMSCLVKFTAKGKITDYISVFLFHLFIFLSEGKCPGTKIFLCNIAWCDLAEPWDNCLSYPSSAKWNWAISANILLSSDIVFLKENIEIVLKNIL